MEIFSLFNSPLMIIYLVVAIILAFLFIHKIYKGYKITHFEQKFSNTAKKINIRKHLKQRKKRGYLNHYAENNFDLLS